MKRIVTYYTDNGNSKKVAKVLSEKLNCELFELKEARERKSGLFGFMKRGMDASLGIKSKLNADIFDKFSNYEDIIITAPVWAGTLNPVISSFLNAVDIKDKHISLFTCQADPSLGALKKVKKKFYQIVNQNGGITEKCFCIQGSSPNKKPLSNEHFDEAVSLLLK